MLARGISRVSVRSVRSAPVRGFRSTPKSQGDHAMFEDLPFKSGKIGMMVVGAVVGGVGAVVGSCVHQNKKHGFSGVSAN